MRWYGKTGPLLASIPKISFTSLYISQLTTFVFISESLMSFMIRVSDLRILQWHHLVLFCESPFHSDTYVLSSLRNWNRGTWMSARNSVNELSLATLTSILLRDTQLEIDLTSLYWARTWLWTSRAWTWAWDWLSFLFHTLCAILKRRAWPHI